MRPIKFRAWDTDLKRWHRMAPTISRIHTDNTWTLEPTPFVILMQYTGLLDKNGVEIYEGDIVFLAEYHGDGLRYEVSYDEATWNLTSSLAPDDYLTNFTTEEIEVIGNIYESPHLLVNKELL